MTAIEVKEDGTFSVNGQQTKVEDLTQQFLEQLVDDSLEGTVEYKLEGEMPIAKFFSALRDGTAEGSELHELKAESDKMADETAKKKKEGELFTEEVMSAKGDQDQSKLA